MSIPTLKQLDEVRKEGFRPGVVVCVVHGNKILMFYKKEYQLWQLPQGRINNREEPVDALKRVLIEELGKSFCQHLDFGSVEFVEVDRMEFKPGRHQVDTLLDDTGNELEMLGKHYYFCVIKADTEGIEITETQFDQYFWMTFREAYFISDRIYQRGKRRITLKVINALEQLGIIK